MADSHESLPVDRRSYGDLLEDIQPYERLINRRQVAAVMMSHIVYIETDPLPAGFSANWIQRELRGQLGFDGAVFCDDLSMKATESFGPIAERAHLALQAGCDMVPICNDRAAAKRAVAALADYPIRCRWCDSPDYMGQGQSYANHCWPAKGGRRLRLSWNPGRAAHNWN